MISTQSKIKAVFAKTRADIEGNISPCINTNSHNGGFFSVPIIIFSFIEYLGILFRNPVEVKNGQRLENFTKTQIENTSIPYIKEYLGRVRTEYDKYAVLLYALYRNSLVHYFSPNEITISKNQILTWGIIKGSSSNHLALAPEEFHISDNSLIKKLVFTINIDLFYLDLMESIDKFVNDVLNNPIISTNILLADKKLNNPRSLNLIPKYIKNELMKILSDTD